MKNFKRKLIGAIGLLAVVATLGLGACSTGTDPGETNVEDAGAKNVHKKSGNEKDAPGVDDNKPGADQ